MLDELIAAYGSKFFIAAGGVGIALLVLIAILWLLRGRGPSPFVRGGRNRQPRLQVLDAAAVDARRRLVLVRRDGVEHLIMIGGPTDIVIESGIGAARSALAPNAGFETLVSSEAAPAARLEAPREPPRAIESKVSDEDVEIEDDVPAVEEIVAPPPPAPPAEIARPRPVIVKAPEPIVPPRPEVVTKAAALEAPLRVEPMVDIAPPPREEPPIATPAQEPQLDRAEPNNDLRETNARLPEFAVDVDAPPARIVAEALPVIEPPTPPQSLVEPATAVEAPTIAVSAVEEPRVEVPPVDVQKERPFVPSPPAFEPRPRLEQTVAFEPVRRPPPVEAPQPTPQPAPIVQEARPDPVFARTNDEFDAADLLDAARHRVFGPEHGESREIRDPVISSPAQSQPVTAEGFASAGQDGRAATFTNATPAVAIDATDPKEPPKARELGTDFESILEAEMSNNLNAQRHGYKPPAPQPPAAAEPVPGQRREPDLAPLSNADSNLQREVARIFGEMSVNRDK